MFDFRKYLSRIFKRSDLSGIYFNRQGIKCYNQLISSSQLQKFATGSQFVLSTSELHIGFDGLNDTTTLLDTPIASSPHFDLVQAIDQNEARVTCDYLRRIRQGTLDFRPKNAFGADLENLKTKFFEMKRLSMANQIDAVKTFEIANKFYVIDGKHRAATCHLLGLDIACQDITPAIYDSFYHWIYRKMKRKSISFMKHIRWFDAAYG